LDTRTGKVTLMNLFRINSNSGKEPHSKGLHVVALFEGAKVAT